MTRVDGERRRLLDQIKMTRALMDGLESTVVDGHPTTASAQSVADAGIRIATIAGRLDAFEMAARKP